MHSCIHLTLVSYDLKSSKRLDLVSIWSFDEFLSLYLRFLNIKPISYLTMVCYHQNPIRRTLGLTHPNQHDKEQDRTCWHNQNRTKSIIKSSITNLCTTQHHSECYNRFTFYRRVYNCQWNITK